MNTIYDFKVKNIDSEVVSLANYSNQVLLIVNTASKCGFTKQYQALEELYNRYKDQGFVVLGFPCNQFMSQEPLDNLEIKNFCQTKYNVTFPLFVKIDVNGENTAPLYAYLKSNAPGILNSEAIKWNFTKFLVSRDGVVIDRYAPIVDPLSLTDKIEQLLRQ